MQRELALPFCFESKVATCGVRHLRSLLRLAPSVPATAVSAYLYLLSAFGDLEIPDGELKAKRKPRGLPLLPGVPQLRSADWQSAATLLQQPPRYTRYEPSLGPLGSLTAPLGYSTYLSLHHSQTFPCISYRPQAFGSKSPTVCVR